MATFLSLDACEMASLSDDTSTFNLESVVRGHHVYKRVGTPCVGEQLMVQHEEDNPSDWRAVAVIKNDVGHLPREIAKSN